MPDNIDTKAAAKARRALLRLTKYPDVADTEAAHRGADRILCELLTELGYGSVVEAYHRIDKWYA